MTSSMAQTTGSSLHVGHGNSPFLPQQMWECSCRLYSMLHKCLLPVWNRVEVGLSGRSRAGVVMCWAAFCAVLLQVTLNAVIVNCIIKGGFCEPYIWMCESFVLSVCPHVFRHFDDASQAGNKADVPSRCPSGLCCRHWRCVVRLFLGPVPNLLFRMNFKSIEKILEFPFNATGVLV